MVCIFSIYYRNLRHINYKQVPDAFNKYEWGKFHAPRAIYDAVLWLSGWKHCMKITTPCLIGFGSSISSVRVLIN